MTADRSGIRARLAAAEEVWLWHEATDDCVAGYGAHMGQMLYRLPQDGQTVDMRASIEGMVTDLAALLAELDAKDAALARVRELADELTEQGDHHVDGCMGQADCARCVQLDLRAALDGDGTPGPTNATDAPTVAKRTAQTTPNTKEG